MITHIKKLYSLKIMFWAAHFIVDLNEQDRAAILCSL